MLGTIIAIFLISLVASGYLYIRDQWAASDIAEAYYAGDDDVVIEKVDRLLRGKAISSENVSWLFWKAEAEYRSGRTDAALTTYGDALAKLEGVTNNVSRRAYAESYLRFGELLSEKGRLNDATSAVQTGLRLNPQNIEGQIFCHRLRR